MQARKQTRAHNWSAVFGFAFFVGMMAIGYFYNLTFVQLGLVDLGTRVVGLTEEQVATSMAYFALLTSGVAVLVGLLMRRRGWSESFVVKLRLAFLVVLVQTLLTAVAPLVRTEGGFLAWIVVGSLAMGVGVPATFGLTVDLVPVRHRGLFGALVTAGAFFPAAVFSSNWQIEQLARQMLPPMVGGVLTLGLLAFGGLGVPNNTAVHRASRASRGEALSALATAGAVLSGALGLVARLAEQHRRPEFGEGRFVRRDARGRPRVGRKLVAALLLMFGIYFMDSLGFLRVVVTPVLVAKSWQSPELSALLFIGLVHVVGALIAGILYRALDVRLLFAWIFGLFALVHYSYTFHARLVPESYVGLGTAMLYALAVSMYTVLNFALWADLSTPRTITLHAALGVALSAWLATFLSTAVSLQWRAAGLPLVEHFNLLAALAMALFLVILAGSLIRAWSRSVGS